MSGKAAERKLMRRVFEEIADEQRLDRLRYWLRSKLADAHQASWDDVLTAAQAAFPEEYARAVAAAEKAVKADEKALAGPPKKKRKKKRDAAEALAEQKAEEEAERMRVEAVAAAEKVRQVATRRFVYLELAMIAELKERGPRAHDSAPVASTSSRVGDGREALVRARPKKFNQKSPSTRPRAHRPAPSTARLPS